MRLRNEETKYQDKLEHLDWKEKCLKAEEIKYVGKVSFEKENEALKLQIDALKQQDSQRARTHSDQLLCLTQQKAALQRALACVIILAAVLFYLTH